MHTFDILARAAFGLAGAALMLLALALIFVAFYQVTQADWPPGIVTGSVLLDGVGYITIAIFLEALVTVFDAGKQNPSAMLYPTLLLLAGVALVVGLGVYQRLSAKVEVSAAEAPEPMDSTRRPAGNLGGRKRRG